MKKLKITTLLLLPLSFYGFRNFIPETIKNQLTAISFIYNVQVINPRDGQAVLLNDTTNFYYDTRYTIYELPYCRYYSKDSLDQNFKVTNYHQWIEKGTSFFIYNNVNPIGLMYDSLTVVKPRKMPVDSFLKAQMFKDNPFFAANNETLSSTSTENGVLVKKYSTINQYENTVADSCYYYFDKNLSDVKYSFSTYLDSLEHSKVFKMKFIFLKKTYKNKEFPARVLVFQIKRNDSVKKEVIDFYKKFMASKENY
ncbi:hypothetical protein [Mucilaginibacter paludis]|uniref:Uncharacterized protein n=1 Tax=Mucilaginibacter paludis DSM 18603 TaxID=714943 RepID=H1Y3U2_9SPHI|nr:hypothetical protein [Mucilaginibacter paludis]EHQ30354.1 hypothetical protein Mucpa_6298 [Mucilaginibacter paludis DSM 18603]